MLRIPNARGEWRDFREARRLSGREVLDCRLLRRLKRSHLLQPLFSCIGALALTVGSLCKMKIPSSGEVVLYPSPMTRVGPGYKGMIKPEFIEIGGDGFGDESKVITINPNWIREGRLFTLVGGTSFSAPKIAHYAAKLFNTYPDYSCNLIKALLINSASIPEERPLPLSEIKIDDSAEKAIDLLKIYGYGKPNIEKALKSESNRVILIKENKIKLKKFHVYSIYLPKEFIEEGGDKALSVTLVYDPPTNRNRSDYFGSVFEFHLYKDSTIEEVIDEYKQLYEGFDLELVDDALSSCVNIFNLYRRFLAYFSPN